MERFRFKVHGSRVHGLSLPWCDVTYDSKRFFCTLCQGILLEVLVNQVWARGYAVMKIERFEDIEAWQLARELTRKVYHLTKKPEFARDYGLKRQIQDAAGSSMHNIAEGFDSETNGEFIRFLRYSKRSCSEVQSELYIAMDEEYISPDEFKDVYEQARRTRAAVRGFINYLKKYEEHKSKIPDLERGRPTVNLEP